MHTLCEGNACADYLAKLAARNLKAYSRIAILLVGLSLFMLAGASGTLFSR
jgi:hypothetical protein